MLRLLHLLVFLFVMPGWRQRQEADRSRSPPRDRGPFGFGVELTSWLRDWAWGRSPAVDLVRNAANRVAADSRTSCPFIRRLAQCKGNEQNAERIVKSIIPAERFPDVTYLANSTVDTVLLPSATFRWLQELSPRKFCIHMGAKLGGVADWWVQFASSAEGMSMWAMHPWLRNKTPQDLNYHLPLMLFDDSGPVSDANSSYARCYYSLLGVGSEKETRIIMATGLKKEGNDLSWASILPSFEELAGDVVAGAWGGILLFSGCDMEYACNEFGMCHFNSLQPCAFCDANTTDLPHTDYSNGAMWRHTIRDNVGFLAHFRLPKHPFVDHALFSIHTYRLDIMHLLDHHGVTSLIAGNLIAIHVRDRDGILPGSTIDDRLDFFNSDMRACNSVSGVRNRLPPLRQSNLTGDSGYPDLHGPLVKASNTRSLVPYLVDLQERAVSAYPTPQNRHMLKVVKAVHLIYETLYAAGYFLTAVEKASIAKLCNRLGLHYQVLAVQAVREGLLLWKETPKLHYLVGHLATQSRLINPRYVQGYTSESMVGTMADIYGKSMAGPHHATVQAKFARKYCVGLTIDWTLGAII
jgi:hypothetical protein